MGGLKRMEDVLRLRSVGTGRAEAASEGSWALATAEKRAAPAVALWPPGGVRGEVR